MIEEGRRCGTCFVTVSGHHVQLARRVEQMQLFEHGGKKRTSIKVYSDDILLEFCDHACWSAREQSIVEAFELAATYPPFHGVASCCRCGAAISRTKPYVTLNIYEVIEESSPWMTSAKMLDDKEFAVLCNDCDEPAEANSSDAEIDEPALEALV